MKTPTVAQLQAFLWTANLGTVERAAAHLRLSQPTVSLRLKALERGLGGPIFERAGRGIVLTQFGRSMLPRAHAVLETIDEMRPRKNGAMISGTIRLGLAEGFALVCLAPVLRRLHERFPYLNPEITVATSASLEPDIQSHRLDLAFVVTPPLSPQFVRIPLGTQETGWMISACSDMPQIVRPRDLAHVPIVSNSPSSIGFQQVHAWFANAGLSPSRIDICSSVAMLALLVAEGRGAAILPSKLADSDLLRGKVRLLKASPAIESVPIFATYHTDRHSEAITAMVDTVREVLSKMDYLRA